MKLAHTDRLHSAPHRHGPTDRHVLLRLRLPLPWHFPYDGLQGAIPNLLYAQRLRYANCVVRAYWGCRGSRRWWWTDISICSPNSIPIESLFPPYALRNELFLEWRIYHLCRRHYCGYFHRSRKRCIHGKRESIQSQIAIRLTLTYSWAGPFRLSGLLFGPWSQSPGFRVTYVVRRRRGQKTADKVASNGLTISARPLHVPALRPFRLISGPGLVMIRAPPRRHPSALRKYPMSPAESPMELMTSLTMPPAVPLTRLLTLPMQLMMGQLLAVPMSNHLRRNYPCNMYDWWICSYLLFFGCTWKCILGRAFYRFPSLVFILRRLVSLYIDTLCLLYGEHWDYVIVSSRLST